MKQRTPSSSSAPEFGASRPHRAPMSPPERLDEVARLLALGFLRLRARRAKEKAQDPNHPREFGLDFAADGSVSDTDAQADRERT